MRGLRVRCFGFFLVLIASGCFVPSTLSGRESGDAAKEAQEEQVHQRFLQLLQRRPVPGTALDRVYGYAVNAGQLSELITQQTEKAEQATDPEEAGRHWMVAGLLQSRRGQDRSAVKAFLEAENKLLANCEVPFQRGQALWRLGDYDTASQAFEVALSRDPGARQDYLKVAIALARVYQRTGQREKALQTWRRLESRFPTDDRVRETIAKTLREEGDLQGALARYEALARDARSDSDKVAFEIRAAAMRIQMGERNRGIEAYESILERVRPGSYLHGEARRGIEEAFLRSGDDAGLVNYYERWVEAHADDVDVMVRLARSLSAQGRKPEAVEWFKNVIERVPSDPNARLALIDTYVSLDQIDEASRQFEALITIDPDHPDYLIRWGQLLLLDTSVEVKQRGQNAAAIWNRLTERRPQDPVIRAQVAELLRQADRTEEALAELRIAVQLAPDQPQYKELLGKFLYELQREEEAVAVWKSLASGDLRTRGNLFRLAEVLRQFERTAEALETMEAVMQLDPTVDERLVFAKWLSEAESHEQALEQIRLAEGSAASIDQSERVFAAAVHVYKAAGELTSQIASLQSAAAASNQESLWRRLAVLCQANEQHERAFKAIEKALEQSPDSIVSMKVAARLADDAGLVQEAIRYRLMLSETDQRFRRSHLQRLSELYSQSGDVDAALRVGKEMLAVSSGAIDAFQFYADLCGRAGRRDEQLETLHRCLRLNPNSVDAQRSLAEHLANEFQTERAIELYWQMFDQAIDIDSKRAVTEELADLHLRSNQLGRLMTRLDQLRGLDNQRVQIDLVATVFERVGDLGRAVEKLESLLRDDGRDTLLLERIVELCKRTGDYEKAVEYQKQLTRLVPSNENESKLATLMVEIGDAETAEAMWMRLAKGTDRSRLLRAIDRFHSLGEDEFSQKLAVQSLES
ncbi:MAG: tetratricopeptide repeat protein, partial [Planctomycetota bacterium]